MMQGLARRGASVGVPGLPIAPGSGCICAPRVWRSGYRGGGGKASSRRKQVRALLDAFFALLQRDTTAKHNNGLR